MAKEKKQYRVIDWLEWVLVGTADTLTDARRIAAKFTVDTDDECDLTIEKLDRDTGKYVFYEGIS